MSAVPEIALTATRAVSKPTTRQQLIRALILSQVLAVVWWLAAVWIREANLIPVWYDQSITFSRVNNLANPYEVVTFMYPPWAVFVFAFFNLFPLPMSVLMQTCIYFAVITAVLFKFGGSTRTVIVTLTSFVALDSALELNIEWLVYLGLLLPPEFSGIFFLIKPQAAFGYWFSFQRRTLVQAIIVLLIALLVSFVLWGAWPMNMLNAVQAVTISGNAYSLFNVAPLHFLPAPISILIGLWLAWRAFRRHDPILGILAWLFFTPYVAFYGLLLPLGLVAIRWFRLALLISVLIWLMYGGVIVYALLVRMSSN